ncbi:MAG: hypothetical protein ANABAC_1505 [Anaerolineae bacterium]|nr:MAG: hypothetical protein ANABAC_1505 [Anaerolineae bacterium]
MRQSLWTNSSADWNIHIVFKTALKTARLGKCRAQKAQRTTQGAQKERSCHSNRLKFGRKVIFQP